MRMLWLLLLPAALWPQIPSPTMAIQADLALTPQQIQAAERNQKDYSDYSSAAGGPVRF